MSSPQREHSPWYYHGMALATITMWSFSYLFIVWINQDLDPLGVVVGRHDVFAVLVLGILLWRRPNLRAITPKQWVILLGFGLIGGPVYHSVFAWAAGQNALGDDRTSTALLGLIMATVPVHTAWLGWIFLREKLTTRKVIALAFGLGGVAVVIIGQHGRIDLLPREHLEGPLGITLAAIGGGCIVVFTRAGRRFLGAWDLIGIGGFFMVTFAALLHPWAGFERLPEMSTIGWVSLLWLGLLGSGAAMITWATALGGLPAVTASMYLFMASVLAATWGWLFRGQPVGWPLLAGGAMVFAGLVIQARNGNSSKTQSDSD